jgi:TonB family protein
MFEYAISQHKKHPPSKRFFASWTLSCVLHVIALMLLIEYPQLLSPGQYPWFRQPALLFSILTHSSGRPQQESNSRIVAFVGKSSGGRMIEPSAETLRRYMYDWSKKGNGVPPVRVRWGNEKQQALAENSPPKTRPVPGIQEPKPSGVSETEKAVPSPAGVSGTGGGEEGSPTVRADAGKPTVYLPAPQPASETRPVKTPPETSAPPQSIPAGITQPAPPPASTRRTTPAQSQASVLENEQKAVRTEGSGLFDTQGFPLGEYANLIIERVKGNWLIPSNLRSAQGRTTVIFYIDKDGRFTNLHIVTPSGSSSLDLAALNAVMESNPFPPLPKGFPGERVGAKFVFSYNERQ